MAILASSLAPPPGATAERTPGMVVVRVAEAAPSLFGEVAQSAPSSSCGIANPGELQKFEDHIAPQGEARNVVVGAQATSFSSASAASTGTSITSSAEATLAVVLQAQGVQQEPIDPVIRQGGITRPAFGGKGRLVLRAFERCCTDRTIADKRGDTALRTRVVEEWFVYSEIFPPNWTAGRRRRPQSPPCLLRNWNPLQALLRSGFVTFADNTRMGKPN